MPETLEIAGGGSRTLRSRMGAVRVRARLTNAVDEGLVRRGLLRKDRKEAVDVTEPGRVALEGRHPAEEALVLGDEVLIGTKVE